MHRHVVPSMSFTNLLTSKARITERIFAGSRFTDSKHWWVSRYSTGNSLPVSIKGHCFAKKELKLFAFSIDQILLQVKADSYNSKVCCNYQVNLENTENLNSTL